MTWNARDAPIDGDMAIETGEYDETIVMGGDPPMNVTGNYVMVCSRGADGEWRIQRFIAADMMMADGGEASAP